MKLAHPQWVHTVEWDSSHPASLILEDPNAYRNLVQDLTIQANGEEGTAVLSDNGRPCSLAKEGLLIRDLWAAEPNQKKILTGIYRQLANLAQEEHYGQLCEVISQGEALMEALSRESMLDLTWETPVDLNPLLKAYGVQVEHSEDPFERLLDQARLSREFLPTHFLILVGVRSFLKAEECQAFCRELALCEMPVLWIEPSCQPMIEQEVRLVIDEDACELYFP